MRGWFLILIYLHVWGRSASLTSDRASVGYIHFWQARGTGGGERKEQGGSEELSQPTTRNEREAEHLCPASLPRDEPRPVKLLP
jgi:hypothetical protein